jgi:hypothetical protein
MFRVVGHITVIAHSWSPGMDSSPHDCNGKAKGGSTSLRKCIRPLLEIESPGHDELRCVFFLINGTVVETIFWSRLRARRWELSVRLSYPINGGCGKFIRSGTNSGELAQKTTLEAVHRLLPNWPSLGPGYANQLVGCRCDTTTLIGARVSSASSHGPNGNRSRLTRKRADRAPYTRSLHRYLFAPRGVRGGTGKSCPAAFSSPTVSRISLRPSRQRVLNSGSSNVS